MTFTNTDSVKNCIVSWLDKDQTDDAVDDEVEWKVHGQIKPIKTKIKQEIYK